MATGWAQRTLLPEEYQNKDSIGYQWTCDLRVRDSLTIESAIGLQYE